MLVCKHLDDTRAYAPLLTARVTRGRARIHLDASEPGKPRRALCGWAFVDTTTDLSRVSCKACLSVMQRGRAAPERDLDRQAQALLAPKAGPPPRLTPQLWGTSCRGGEHRRCGVCEICLWEREAEMWHHVAPWSGPLGLERHENGPRWPSAGAALLAYVEGHAHGHQLASTIGSALERIARGETFGGGKPEAEGPMHRRAADLLAVERALEAAYPNGGHARLAARDCRMLLLSRTPGVVAVWDVRRDTIKARQPLPMPTFEELARKHGVTVGDVRALVRNGRERVCEELVRRGMIPRPRLDGRKKGGDACLTMVTRN